MPYLQKPFNQKHQHRYFVDLDTHDALCLCGKMRGSPKAKANKYHAKTIMYNGVSYDSIFEANYAMHLPGLPKSYDL